MEQASYQISTPAVELMDKDETCRFFGGITRPINAATLYRGMQTGRYPKPIKRAWNISTKASATMGWIFLTGWAASGAATFRP